MSLPKTYSVEQVAESLGVHPETLLKEIRSGRLHAARVGRQWRMTEKDVNTYLARKDSK